MSTDNQPINELGWKRQHTNVLTPRVSDYVSPRGVPSTEANPLGLVPTPAIANEQHRVNRENGNFDRAKKRADTAGHATRDALFAARGIIRAIEDLEPIDRLGMLPQGIDRLVAASDRLDDAVDSLVDRLNTAAIAAATEQLSFLRARRNGKGAAPSATLTAAIDPTPPDAGDGG